MDEEKINSKKETEYEKVLREILDENINIESQGEDVEKLTSNYTEYDRTNKMLLKYYNEKTGSDFQNELKSKLSKEAHKKVTKRLDEVDSQLEKDEQEEQIRELSKETLEGEQISKEIEERAIKKAQEKSEENPEVDFKAEVIKAIYEAAFEEYSYLLEKYKKAQLKDDSMTVGDKEGTELVLYEKYLINLEKKYAGYAKSKGLKEKTLTEDTNIKEKKDKLEYEMKKMTRSNDKSIKDNLQRIRILADRRNAIADRMLELSENRKNMSPEQFKQSMEYYQNQYFEVTIELRSQDPSLEEYKSQIMQENENIEYSNRIIGERSDNIIAGAYQEIDAYGDVKEDLGDENLEEIEDISEDYVVTTQDSVEDMIKEAKTALQYGEIERAIEIVESAEMITFGKEGENLEYEEESTKESDEQIKEDMEQNQEEDFNSSFMQEMESGVASAKEARIQERIRELEEHLLKDKEQIEIQKDDMEQVPVRTRFNKKN